jgi:hypothetical protein
VSLSVMYQESKVAVKEDITKLIKLDKFDKVLYPRDKDQVTFALVEFDSELEAIRYYQANQDLKLLTPD